VNDTLSVILKYEADIRKGQQELKEFVQRERARVAAEGAGGADGDKDARP
jgi:hypothetical protein